MRILEKPKPNDTIESLLERSEGIIRNIYNKYSLWMLNGAEEDLLQDCRLVIVNILQKWLDNPVDFDFNSVISSAVKTCLLNKQHFYKCAVTIKSWPGYKKLHAEHKMRHDPLFSSSSLDKFMFDDEKKDSYTVLASYFQTPPEQLKIHWMPNYLSEILTPVEIELVNLLFETPQYRHGDRKKKWQDKILKLLPKTVLRPRNINNFFYRGNQNIDRFRYKIMWKVCEYYKTKGYNVEIPKASSYMYPKKVKKPQNQKTIDGKA